MVLMGNPKPEKVMAGMMKKNDVTIACCCVAEMVEISKPTPSMHKINRTAPSASTETWPRKGTWNHSDPTTEISATSKMPIRKNGSVLPRMNSAGRMGVTIICSSVPISRSRTTAKAVSVITRTSVRLPMIPGTKNQRLLRSGLYQGRGASST